MDKKRIENTPEGFANILNQAHHYSVHVRINGEDRVYSADFLKQFLNDCIKILKDGYEEDKK